MSTANGSNPGRRGVWLTTPALLAVGTLFALAGGSQTRPILESWPLMAWCWIAGLNVLAWIPAALMQSERFYDLVGSTSFISSALGIWWFTEPGLTGTLMLACVVLWSARMAWFLVGRIHRQGKDGRFDTIKTDPHRFLNTWLMQALWAFLCMLPVLSAMGSSEAVTMGPWTVAGLTVWSLGFVIEVIADEQKRRFRLRHPDGSRFISSGLWSMSRHPNYVGEILLWTGLTVAALPVLEGWQYAALITPVFVFVLLRYVSGVPLLEERADQRWGGQADYEAYKAGTPILFPIPGSPA